MSQFPLLFSKPVVCLCQVNLDRLYLMSTAHRFPLMFPFKPCRFWKFPAIHLACNSLRNLWKPASFSSFFFLINLLSYEQHPRFSHCQRVSLKAFNPWDQNLLIQKIKNYQGSEGWVVHLVNFYHCWWDVSHSGIEWDFLSILCYYISSRLLAMLSFVGLNLVVPF